MLSAKGLTYKKENTRILSDIHIDIPKQKIIGFLGPNGVGKTTLMQLLSGLRYVQAGDIELNGNSDRDAILQHTVYMDHTFNFPESWTGCQVASHYKLASQRFNHQKFLGMIKQLEIDLEKPLKTLSRGQKERLVLSLTLSQDADYYFLDEPLTGIDMITREEIIRSILIFADTDATIIISSHYLELFEMLFDEVYFIKEGQIVGQVECEVMREEHGLTLSEYYVKTYKGGVSIW